MKLRYKTGMVLGIPFFLLFFNYRSFSVFTALTLISAITGYGLGTVHERVENTSRKYLAFAVLSGLYISILAAILVNIATGTGCPLEPTYTAENIFTGTTKQFTGCDAHPWYYEAVNGT